MKYLFVSLDGLIADIAWEVVKEGHDVKFYINDAGEKEIADGFVPKTDNWEREVEWAVNFEHASREDYREDVGDRWSEEDSDRLHSWGYLRE